MPTTTLKINANAFDLTGNKHLMLLDNILRLRPRDLNSEEECLAMLSILAGQSYVAGNASLFRSRELSYGSWWNYGNCWNDNSIAGKYSDIVVKMYLSAAAFARFSPISRQMNPSEFTVRFRMRLSDITGSGVLINDLINIVGPIKRWYIYWDPPAGSNRLRLVTYNSAGAARTAYINDVSNILANTWYQWQITYSASNTRMRVRVKDDGGVTKLTGADNSAYVIPAADIYSGASLNFGAYFNDHVVEGGVATGKYPKALHLDWLTYLNGESADDFTVFSAVPTIYATGVGADVCDGVSTVLEAPHDGKNPTWDMSSLAANPGISTANSVLGSGWTVRYRAGDTNPPAGAWSDWMTTAQFVAESDPSGRYFEFGVRCHNNDGVSEFYPAVWFTIDCITDPVLEILFPDDWRIHTDDIPSLRDRIVRSVCHDCSNEENPDCPPGCDREVILDADISGDDAIVPKTVT